MLLESVKGKRLELLLPLTPRPYTHTHTERHEKNNHHQQKTCSSFLGTKLPSHGLISVPGHGRLF